MATVEIPRIDADRMSIEPEGLYEVVDGQIVETPTTGVRENRIAARLIRHLNIFDLENPTGEVIGETLFVLDAARGLKRRPDVAFVSFERWPKDREVPPGQVAWDVVPDLAVEVVSPSNFADEVVDKVAEYFRAGALLVWFVYPSQSLVYVYESPTSVRIVPVGSDLVGGSVLPGFRMPVGALFGGGGGSAGS